MHDEQWIDLASWSPAETLTASNRGFHAALQDGTPVLIRPVTPGDKMRIEKGLARMSSRSIYFRFGRHLSRLSDRDLRYFTEVDQVQHIAWGAVDPGDPTETGLGVARLICEARNPTRAEVALAVIDAYHGIGLGTVLLATLCALGKSRQIEILRACVLPENHLVVSWFRRLGAELVDDDGLMVLDLDLRAGLPDSQAARRFESLVNRVKQIVEQA
jgi:GNAT superfamily N-acetyltransferase